MGEVQGVAPAGTVMGAIQELTAQVDVEVRKSVVRIYRLGEPAIDVQFNDVPAFSRAMSVAKESPEYQAYLTKKGLA